VCDLSEGGACIELDGPVQVGTETYVGFFLKDESRPLVAVARVVWARSDGPRHLMGVQFSTETAAQRAAIGKIADYLAARRLELVVS
jgi:Tfp pilus assembly protein PilZ